MNASTKHTVQRLIRGLLLSATAALLAVPSYGASPLNTERQAIVNYGDLNLAEAEGAATLHARLRNAARHVCGSRPDLRDLRSSRSWEMCYEEALTVAVMKIDRPVLTRMYLADTQHR